MRRKGLRVEIVVSACINIFRGTSEVFDRVVQLAKFMFPSEVVAVESWHNEEA